MSRKLIPIVSLAILMWLPQAIFAQLAGSPSDNDMVVAQAGQSLVTIAVSPDAGQWERQAADDLAKYIQMMTGGLPQILTSLPQENSPALVVGKLAVQAKPDLVSTLTMAAKQNPVVRADAIVLKREGNRLYLAGSNDDSHYYAVSQLLHLWGCRWYVPSEFGECVPTHATLKVGDLNLAYGPRLEVRRYWISWLGEQADRPIFMRRNFMNDESVPSGHSLSQYTKEVEPPGKGHFAIPITDPRTADGVAKLISERFAKGERISLGIEDGMYDSDYPRDKELLKLQYDKYFLTPSYTDCFLTFYNNVAETLLKQHPQSNARIGFLAYSNLTLPPIQVQKAAAPLVAYLAPIDIDPNHGMDSPLSGPRRELKDMVYKWSEVMDGRVVIYDYDQGMLVWRDIPNPSHHAFRQDVKHYVQAGILGVDTESRNATATTFLNLFFRGQLMWNAESDVDAMLTEFYPKFYGPAAEPMAAYWSAIYKAWEETLATEHEYFVAPAIYSPELIAELSGHLRVAETLISQFPPNSRENRQYHERIKFTRLGFGVLENYMGMVTAANAEVDYAKAVQLGKQALALRESLTAMNPNFTTYKAIGESGYAWFPGEVQQYEELLTLTDGTKGTLIAKLPLIWSYRRDPQDVGLKQGWIDQVPDLTWWRTESAQGQQSAHVKNQAGHWEEVRTDLYLQAQGVVTSDYQSYDGHGWYRTDIELTSEQLTKKVFLKFPGVFNEFWLYVNGQEVHHRPFKGLWWLADYRFEVDVDLTNKLQPGKNTLVIRHYNPHHFGGLFRRPFLYRPK
jgi:Domain of unknown function (DUF4838)/Glycosyl hydrolases family 2, sugar binding domain